VPATVAQDSNDTDESGEHASIWVAVYRSNQNQPSVLVRDEFLHAMRSATDMTTTTTTPLNPAFVRDTTAATPVAVARLLRRQPPSSTSTEEEDDTTTTFLIDSLRCTLKKETTDAACDGGSEHTEALMVALDTLVLHYLRQPQSQESMRFHGCLRVKGTLVTGPLLEDRGWDPVLDLEPDWATHTSSLDGCLTRYAARAVAMAPLTHQQRAMEIVLRLGRLDRDADLAAAAQMQRQQRAAANIDDKEDPWAEMKRLL
jgi:hypothetical protein